VSSSMYSFCTRCSSSKLGLSHLST
jgi:hypothetical protein